LKYDYYAIQHMREVENLPWLEIARRVGAPLDNGASTLRGNYYKWRKQKSHGVEGFDFDLLSDDTILKSGFSEHRITSLDQLFDFFEIPYRWIDGKHGERIPVSDDYDVVSFRVNSWEQHSVKKGITTLYQVRATLQPKAVLDSIAAIDAMFDEFTKLHETCGPDTSVLPRPILRSADRPQMMEMFLVDPHLGMLAWAPEVGLNYDIEIGIRDYKDAFVELLGWSQMYNVEEILVHIGHDLFHVDAPGFDARGGTRGGATTKGTMQDLDTRLARMFVKVEKLIIECIEECAARFPKVTVQMVPGNHDRHTVFKLGRVISAWFRNIPHVEVRNSPSVRTYYGYGSNVFMFTHGEEFYRNRDNMATIFATECPPELWVRGKVREIHVGHNHINKQKVWDGRFTEEVWEGRAIRVRSLPGLTPEDSWHFESGYKHQRRGTVMFWDRSGGMAGYHEVTL